MYKIKSHIRKPGRCCKHFLASRDGKKKDEENKFGGEAKVFIVRCESERDLRQDSNDEGLVWFRMWCVFAIIDSLRHSWTETYTHTCNTDAWTHTHAKKVHAHRYTALEIHAWGLFGIAVVSLRGDEIKCILKLYAIKSQRSWNELMHVKNALICAWAKNWRGLHSHIQCIWLINTLRICETLKRSWTTFHDK